MTTPSLPEGFSPAITTNWPLPGVRWPAETRDFVGVYALVWKDHAYVGMTVSNNGFKGRWMRHHRTLFVAKRANSTTKAFRSFIKANGLTAQDFTLYALRTWPKPEGEATRELSDEIALVEVEAYDALASAGFSMLNNVRPRGTGYSKPVRRKRRRRRRTRPAVGAKTP